MATVATTTPSSSFIGLDGVGLRIGGFQILDDITLDVQKGEMLALIGPNGAGKTSLLNVLSGILKASAGTVRMGDNNITGWSLDRRTRAGIGRTFQTSYLFLGLSVLDNVALAAQSAGARAGTLLRSAHRDDESLEKARAALDRVGLLAKAHRHASSLSHGERRHLELAFVLAKDDDLVLLDEPIAGVSSEEVPGLTELIRSIHVERGSTMIMVEHHLPVVLGLADRVAVLHNGKVLTVDIPSQVMANETVTAAYVGDPL